jgi:hypothetical protein
VLAGGAAGWAGRAAAAAATAAGPRPGAASSLRWPLDLPPAVVSSFGEYRYDHMHAGLDLSTGGITGQPVRAAADGSVYRLKVEWRGYGRALYLKHTDGRTSVYGHLERFEDRTLGLERQVARRQHEAGTRYPGDIYLDPPLPVRRGQVIAFSGESGVGLPHLHFEMRGPGDEPIDPLRNGLPRPADRQPPVLESLVITAADESAWIDGVSREKIMPLRRRAAGYETAEPLRVSGPFRADLSAWDPAGGGRAGIRFLEARVDGQTCYRLDFNSFRFDQYPIAGLIFDHRHSHLGPTRMAWRLARLPGNALASGGCEAFTGGGAPPGAYLLPEGAHRLEVVARDGTGVESRALLCILVASPGPVAGGRLGGSGDRSGAIVRFDPSGAARSPAPTAAQSGEGGDCAMPGWAVESDVWGGGRFAPLECREAEGVCVGARGGAAEASRCARLRQVSGGVPGPWDILAAGAAPLTPRSIAIRPYPTFVDVIAEFADPCPGVPGTGCTAPGMMWRALDGLRLGAGLSYATLAGWSVPADAAGTCPLAGALARLVWRNVAPEHAAELDGDGYRVELPAGSRFYPGPMMVRTSTVTGDTGGLRPLRDAIEILPDGEALDARASLAFTLPGGGAEEVRQLGVYRFDAETGRWGFEGDEIDPGTGAIVVRFRRYGRFALLRDDLPPVVRAVRPAPGTQVGRHPEIAATVEEVGKGLNYDGVAFVLDGALIESEYDPDHGTARPFDPPSLGPGRHHLRVTATDRAGNVSASIETDFVVR